MNSPRERLPDLHPSAAANGCSVSGRTSRNNRGAAYLLQCGARQVPKAPKPSGCVLVDLPRRRKGKRKTVQVQVVNRIEGWQVIAKLLLRARRILVEKPAAHRLHVRGCVAREPCALDRSWHNHAPSSASALPRRCRADRMCARGHTSMCVPAAGERSSKATTALSSCSRWLWPDARPFAIPQKTQSGRAQRSCVSGPVRVTNCHSHSMSTTAGFGGTERHSTRRGV